MDTTTPPLASVGIDIGKERRRRTTTDVIVAVTTRVTRLQSVCALRIVAGVKERLHDAGKAADRAPPPEILDHIYFKHVERRDPFTRKSAPLRNCGNDAREDGVQMFGPRIRHLKDS